MLQRPPGDIIGRPFMSFVHPDQRATSLARYFHAVAAAAHGQPTTARHCALTCLTPAHERLEVSVAWTILEPDHSGAQFAIMQLTRATAAHSPGA